MTASFSCVGHCALWSCSPHVCVVACLDCAAVNREEVFALPLTDDAAIKNVINDFAPFYQLWTTVSEFDTAKQHWLSGLFSHLKASEITESMERWWIDCSNLTKKFKVCERGGDGPDW